MNTVGRNNKGGRSSATSRLHVLHILSLQNQPVSYTHLDVYKRQYLAHLTTVRVVHGRGTGALKNAVHTRLKKLKYVKEFRLGVFGEGDSGVTIVTFK